MIKAWPRIASKHLGDYHIFTLRQERKTSPRTGQAHDFYVIDSPNWVNVIALTPDQQVVMVEQYRHGSNTVELEIPGGLIEPNDGSPIAAGLRELEEETGYAGEHAQIIGEVLPNPAIMSNTCYTVLVCQCQLKHPVHLDHSEDLTTRLVPAASLNQLVVSGQIRHSLVAVALYHFDLWQQTRD